jgi:hypothetical protein
MIKSKAVGHSQILHMCSKLLLSFTAYIVMYDRGRQKIEKVLCLQFVVFLKKNILLVMLITHDKHRSFGLPRYMKKQFGHHFCFVNSANALYMPHMCDVPTAISWCGINSMSDINGTIHMLYGDTSRLTADVVGTVGPSYYKPSHETSVVLPEMDFGEIPHKLTDFQLCVTGSITEGDMTHAEYCGSFFKVNDMNVVEEFECDEYSRLAQRELGEEIGLYSKRLIQLNDELVKGRLIKRYVTKITDCLSYSDVLENEPHLVSHCMTHTPNIPDGAKCNVAIIGTLSETSDVYSRFGGRAASSSVEELTSIKGVTFFPLRVF